MTSDNLPLPFDLTEKNLSIWLEYLPRIHNNSPDKILTELRLVLPSLKMQNLEISQYLAFLQKIQDFASLYANQMEASCLDAVFPLSTELSQAVHLLIDFYAGLADAFTAGVREISLFHRKEPVARCIYLALSALGTSFLYSKEVYADPFPGFWQRCYGLYQQAEKMKLLDYRLRLDGQHKSTPQEMFALILIFELCSSNQFRSRFIKRIYQHLAIYVQYVKIVAKVEKKYIPSYCRFDITQDQPPKRMSNKTYCPGNNIRFISPVVVAKKMYQNLHESLSGNDRERSIQRRIFIKVINTLGMSQYRKNTRIKTEQYCKAIMGLDALVAYLFHLNPDDPIPCEATQPQTDSRQQSREFSLVPREKDTFMPREEDTLNQLQAEQWFHSSVQSLQVPDTEFDPHPIKIEDFSPQGRRILCLSDRCEAKTGAIIGILPDFTGRIEVGLVCRLYAEQGKHPSMGIRMLSMNAKLACLNKNDLTAWAVLLPATQSLYNKDCIIYNSSFFNSGDLIQLQVAHSDEIRIHLLGRVLNETSAVRHVELQPAY